MSWLKTVRVFLCKLVSKPHTADMNSKVINKWAMGTYAFRGAAGPQIIPILHIGADAAAAAAAAAFYFLIQVRPGSCQSYP